MGFSARVSCITHNTLTLHITTWPLRSQCVSRFTVFTNSGMSKRPFLKWQLIEVAGLNIWPDLTSTTVYNNKWFVTYVGLLASAIKDKVRLFRLNDLHLHPCDYCLTFISPTNSMWERPPTPLFWCPTRFYISLIWAVMSHNPKKTHILANCSDMEAQ